MLRRLTLLRRFRWRRILDAHDPKNAQNGQGPQQQEEEQEQAEEQEEEEDERRRSRLSRTQRASLEREFQISAWLPAPRADEIAARLGTRRSTVKSWCVDIRHICCVWEDLIC